MFTLYLEAVGLVNNNNMDVSGSSKSSTPTIQFVQKDYDAIHVGNFTLKIRFFV